MLKEERKLTAAEEDVMQLLSFAMLIKERYKLQHGKEIEVKDHAVLQLISTKLRAAVTTGHPAVSDILNAEQKKLLRELIKKPKLSVEAFATSCAQSPVLEFKTIAAPETPFYKRSTTIFGVGGMAIGFSLFGLPGAGAGMAAVYFGTKVANHLKR